MPKGKIQRKVEKQISMFFNKVMESTRYDQPLKNIYDRWCQKPGNVSPVVQKYKFDKELLQCLQDPEGITRGELQRTAENILRYCIKRMK